MATHPRILAWEVHGQRSLAGYSPRSHRVRHDSTAQHDAAPHTRTGGQLKHAGLLGSSAQIRLTISGSGKYIPAEFRDQLEFAE